MGRLLALPTSEKFPYPGTLAHRYPVNNSLQDDNEEEDARGERAQEDTLTPPFAVDQDQEMFASLANTDDARGYFPPSFISQPREWTRDELRAYILTYSLKGAKMSKERQAFIGEIVPFESPSDPEVTFGIRRLDNAAIMSYRDKDATVRYIMEDGTDRVITEKDYPMGTRRLETVLLGLATWNITSGNLPVSITRDTILSYLDPDGGELDAVYEKILEINPILNGQQARKNS